MKMLFAIAFSSFAIAIPAVGQQTVLPKEHILFQKLDATIQSESRNLDGVMGVYLVDLAAESTLASNADETFPTASTITIAILAELFHQAQQGKLNLNDIYVLKSS